jgi:hypothetical protein
MTYAYKFHWIFIILIAGALLFWEYPVKENIELVRAQIDQCKANTENLKWNMQLAKTGTELNLKNLARLRKQE